MPEIEQSVLDVMVAKVPEEKRPAFLEDFKSRGYTIKGVAAPSGASGGAPVEEGITPENPLETGVNLVKAAGAFIKSRGLTADQHVLGAQPSDSAGGLPGAIGTGIQKAGEMAEELLPKTPGQVAGMVATDVGVGALAKGYNKFIAASPELRAATDKAIATAKQYGFKMMPSQETQSYLANLFESAMRKLSGGSAVIQKFEQEQNAGFAAAKTKIVQSLGDETQMDFGGSMKEALGAANQALTDRANALLAKGQISKEAYDKALAAHSQRIAQVASDSLKGQRTSAAAGLGGAATPEGRGLAVQLERAHQAALDSMQQQAHWERAMAGMPPEVDQSAAANLVQASGKVAARLKAAGITGERVYKAAVQNLPEEESAEVANILSKARSSGLVDPGGAAAGSEPKTYTLKALQDKQATYAALAEKHRDPSTGSYDMFGNLFRDLKRAADSDMDALFAQPGVPAQAKADYQIAKAFTKERMGMADLQTVKGLWKENPSAILDSVVKAGDRKGTQTLVQALGGGDAGKTQVKRHIFDEIFGSGDEPVPSRDKIMAKLSTYSDNISAIFSKDEQKQLYSMADKAELPKFMQDNFDKRVKSILDNYKQQALAQRDPVLRNLARQQPQQLVEAVMKGDPNVVRSVKKYVSPEDFQMYQRYGMRDLLADPRLPQEGAVYIQKELARKPEFYRELLGEKNFKDMQHIGEAQLLLPGFKDRSGNTPIGQMGMAATFGVLGLMLHPFNPNLGKAAAGVGIGLTIAPQMLTELYLSDGGRRIVTTLLRLPQADPRAAFLVGKLAAAGYAVGSNLYQERQASQKGASRGP